MTKRISIILLVLAGLVGGLYADAPTIVATNGWTAAFAAIAGAQNVEVLAPYEMPHPPEYELSLQELQKVAEADYVLFAGYEAMMSRIRESLGSAAGPELIQIKTINSYPMISESVMKIAAILGTEDTASANLEEIRLFIEDWKTDLRGSAKLENIVVHFHQQGPAKGLGLDPSVVYGPAPPSLGQIREVLSVTPAIIIDNKHNPVASPFEEMVPAPAIVQWINFPGIGGTVSLRDVLQYNRNQLDSALR